MSKIAYFLLSAAALAAASTPAHAVSYIDGTEVKLDASDPFDFLVNYNAISSNAGAPIAGLSAQILFRFLGVTNGGTRYNFRYNVTNTSSAPTASRVTIFGFDTNPNIANASASGVYNFAATGNQQFNGSVEVCFKDILSAACNNGGGGGNGVEQGTSDGGLFSLNFAAAPMNQMIELEDLVVRYQGIQGMPGTTAASGRAVSLLAVTVPEPATWASMLLGFGIIGGAIRRRRQAVVPV